MRILLLLLTVLGGPALAHEFWIEPEDFTFAPEVSPSATLVNGQDFDGINIAYFPNRFSRFEVIDASGARAVEGRLGDRPALSVPPAAPGLVSAVYVSTPEVLTYDDLAAFARFATHKGYPQAEARHRERGLPEMQFRELYTRFCKTLIAQGGAAGADADRGMETEIVAITNPYAPDFVQDMRIRVLALGAPRGDAQVEVWDRAPEGEVTLLTLRTDAAGEAAFPTTPGHSYLVNSTLLREPAPEVAEATGAVWESLWASLTFAVPLPGEVPAS